MKALKLSREILSKRAWAVNGDGNVLGHTIVREKLFLFQSNSNVISVRIASTSLIRGSWPSGRLRRYTYRLERAVGRPIDVGGEDNLGNAMKMIGQAGRFAYRRH